MYEGRRDGGTGAGDRYKMREGGGNPSEAA